MGQGTAPPPTEAAAAPTTRSSGMSPQQAQAVAMLLGQVGKRPPVAGAIQGQMQRPMPQASTVQGGTYFNPNQPR